MGIGCRQSYHRQCLPQPHRVGNNAAKELRWLFGLVRIRDSVYKTKDFVSDIRDIACPRVQSPTSNRYLYRHIPTSLVYLCQMPSLALVEA